MAEERHSRGAVALRKRLGADKVDTFVENEEAEERVGSEALQRGAAASKEKRVGAEEELVAFAAPALGVAACVSAHDMVKSLAWVVQGLVVVFLARFCSLFEEAPLFSPVNPTTLRCRTMGSALGLFEPAMEPLQAKCD